MAKETVEAIRKAETKADQMIRDAHIKADEIIMDARKKAADQLSEAKKDAAARLKQAGEQAAATGAGEAKTSKAESEKDVEALRTLARQKEDEAVKLVLAQSAR